MIRGSVSFLVFLVLLSCFPKFECWTSFVLCFQVPSRMNLRPDATYVLSGGMGALGLVSAQALVTESARAHTSILSKQV